MSDMTLSEELQWRGFINQTTFRNIADLDSKQWTFYGGFDASADSQTVGNLAFMMFNLLLMRRGHKAIILVGGATSLIGDPSGKSTERNLQDEATIAHNIACAVKQLQTVFRGHDFIQVNNLDWTKNLSVIDFLRDTGKYFSMTPLVQRDYIAKRMGEGGEGISYTEFSCTILQGLDYLTIFDRHGATLQIGGADQWGNCLSGVELIRKARGQEVHVITMPLIVNKTTGVKFGKSETGAVWLDPVKTTPTQFYQFWINCDDEGVADYLKIYTAITKDEYDKLMASHRADPKQRLAQQYLARDVTTLVHGEDLMIEAETVTDYLTGKNSIGEAGHELGALRKEIPSLHAQPGADLTEVLVEATLASSKTEARRLLSENSISINGQKTTKDRLEDSDFQNGRLLIRRGKAFKDSALVERQ